ncbi:MAG: DUF2277 domain-containing protein [Pyrinomonadaceae bacterium]
MCRSIKKLYNRDIPTANVEIHEASLQFVRKVSGYRAPSKANQEAFDEAVAETAKVVEKLLGRLVSRGSKSA